MLAAVLLAAAPVAAGDQNCFSIAAGRRATRSGAVLLAHNEDDRPPQIVNWIKVPHAVHPASEIVRLKEGGTLPQVRETAAFVWLQMPGQEFSDSYMNQYGVTIVSNQCPSRVRPEDVRLTGGGIGYWLRRLMAERAHTAREAVRIGGRLVERFGYHATGRTYVIAGPKEAWMLAVVRGRLWVAERVPDDEVAVLANRYTIGRVDLADTADFLGNPEIITYAEKRGWYEAKRDGAFNFRRVYGAPAARYSIRNIARQWRGVTVLSGRSWDPGGELPFAVRPAHRLEPADLMALLRDHFEGTQFATPASFNNGDPHRNFVKRICSETTQYGLVAELRAWLPPELGNVLWFAPRRPCIHPFVPIYAGITGFPPGFARLGAAEAIARQFTPDPARLVPSPRLAYWAFTRRAAAVDADYARLFPGVRRQRDRLQREVVAARDGVEKRAASLLAKDRPAALAALTRFSAEWLGRLWKLDRGRPAGGE